MKMYGGVKVQLHTFSTSALDGSEWSAWRVRAHTRAHTHTHTHTHTIFTYLFWCQNFTSGYTYSSMLLYQFIMSCP